ncbi:hypothetical protein [Pontibacter vulgaris]|uniref:hypothetical protein n=1 Tax=Pontibacter vulgaris TaxID=2905679 RepID=UPI001FA7F5A2|nr:hypothetical protein [Pontibacter vulgaris]
MKILLSVLLFFFCLEAKSTDQAPDILFYEGDKYELYTNHADMSPLESFDQIREELSKQSKWWSSGCWRGYIAEWVIENGQLYLTKVKSCEDGKIVNALIEKAIKRKFVGGKMKADWVSGVYWGGRGERFWNAFDKEVMFSFQGGFLESTIKHTSPNCSFQNKDTLYHFIYSNIDWEKMPSTREEVSIDFETNKEGKIIQAEVRLSNGTEFGKEALRVLKMVPCWKVYTVRGEVFGWRDIDLIFNEENRKKYQRL